MVEEFVSNSVKYIVAHNGSDVYHYIKVVDGNTTTTGLPYLVVFDTKEEAVAEFGDKISILDPNEPYEDEHK
jgi:hypothetical protein